MARETKVGLIVGLGVILFVGIFVSDYLSVPTYQETLGSEDLANFNQQTTNQPQLIITRHDPAADPALTDPELLAVAATRDLDTRFGTPAPPIDPYTLEQPSEPPFRRGNPGAEQAVGLNTPPQTAQHSPQRSPLPLGQRGIDDTGLANTGQLAVERAGPGIDVTHQLRHVQLIEEPVINPAAGQIEHKVQEGEMLIRIARKYYDGDENMWMSIRDANPGKVGANGEIRPGTVLIIPRRSTQGAGSADQLAEAGAPSGDAPRRKRVRMIKVEDGDTLTALAAKHLGSARKWQQIMDVNTDILKKPQDLRVGMKLRIPLEEESQLIEEAQQALNTNTSDRNTGATARVKTHTVEPGDNLHKIAAKHLGDGNRYNEIYEANRDKLKNADDIKVGMELRLPAR